MRGVRGVLTKTARASDLICSLTPTRLLVLTTEPDPGNLNDLLSTLRNSLADLSISGFQVRPKLTLTYVNTADTDDLDRILDELGCRLDEHGNLEEKTSGSKTNRFGSKEHWLSRYQLDEQTAFDLWAKLNCSMVTVPLKSANNETHSEIVKLAKALQSMDHPGIQPLHDFWIDENAIVCVLETGQARPFAEWKKSHRLNPAAYADFVLQYISILLYVQTITAAPIPQNSLAEALFVLPSEPRLFLAHYQHRCFDALGPTKPLSQESLISDVATFAEGLRDGVEGQSADELFMVLQRLKEESIPSKMGTLHKVRAAIKDISDKLGAPRVMPIEKARHA